MTFVRSEPGADPIVVEGHLEAAPARVFEAWTDPEIVKLWFGPRPGSLAAASIDLRTGGRWAFVEEANAEVTTGFEGEYLEIRPNELLRFTWAKVTSRPTGQRDATTTSIVEIRFTATGDGTDVRITHSNLDAESRIGFRVGWESGVVNLVAHLAGGATGRGGAGKPLS